VNLKYLVVACLALSSLSRPMNAQGSGIIGGVLGPTYRDALEKADAIAVMRIDAGQLYPPIFHGTVTEAVKGVEPGAEVCVTLEGQTMPAIGQDALVFLLTGTATPTGRRISSCGTASFFRVPIRWPDPLPVVNTWEVLPCPTPPCARGPVCLSPPCARMAYAVRIPPAAVPGILHSFPATCPDEFGLPTPWVLEDELLAALRKNVTKR
jgi:hypothetical protein